MNVNGRVRSGQIDYDQMPRIQVWMANYTIEPRIGGGWWLVSTDCFMALISPRHDDIKKISDISMDIEAVSCPRSPLIKIRSRWYQEVTRYMCRCSRGYKKSKLRWIHHHSELIWTKSTCLHSLSLQSQLPSVLWVYHSCFSCFSLFLYSLSLLFQAYFCRTCTPIRRYAWLRWYA